MIRTREALKSQAKQVLKTNYWRIVLVSLILFLVSGGLTSTSTATAASDSAASANSSSVVIAAIPVSVVGILLGIFVFAPLSVGCVRFFLANLNAPANLGELKQAFSHNYMTTVKTMFLANLKIFLWTLLLIIPGIVKSYEYRMVPYLLAECPDMDSKEVFAASARLMDGNKWRAFVLDLSFILWYLLGALTAGLVYVFYVNPYKDLTDAAFYQSVCQEKNGEIPLEKEF